MRPNAESLRKAMTVASGESRVKLARLYKVAAARERVRPVHIQSDILASPRGDIEALAGVESNPLHPSAGWVRFERDGIILVDSAVLGERVVVVRDCSTPIPAAYADLAVWSLPELRRVRDALRGGQFRFEILERINDVKRELGGTVLSASSPVLQGEVTGFSTLPVEAGLCESPHRSKRCSSRIASGEPSCHLTLDTAPDDYRLVCVPCGLRYPWTSPAMRQRQVWSKSYGVVI